jgi:hypothetical protein
MLVVLKDSANVPMVPKKLAVTYINIALGSAKIAKFCTTAIATRF